MSIRDRKARVQEATKRSIVQAALSIIKEHGAEALSMRRIGEKIEYSAPVIYSYFSSKEALIAAISLSGLRRLSQLMSDAHQNTLTPLLQLQNAWLAYWNFAITEKELYQLMFGVGTSCSGCKDERYRSADPLAITGSLLRKILNPFQADQEEIVSRSYMIWSMVHGLAAISITQNVPHMADVPKIIKRAVVVFSAPPPL